MPTLDEVIQQSSPLAPVENEVMEHYARRLVRQGALLGAQWGMTQVGPMAVIIGQPGEPGVIQFEQREEAPDA